MSDIPQVELENALITFKAHKKTDISYSIYDTRGNLVIPEKKIQLVKGYNKDILPSKALERIILILKVTGVSGNRLYKLIPKIDIINLVDGISTKLSTNSLIKILGEDHLEIK